MKRDKLRTSQVPPCVLPVPDDIYRYFSGIFERQYYTESGPLVQMLERILQEQIHTKNVVCVSNASIGWLMLLSLRFEYSKILLPNKISRPLNEALNWLNSKCKQYGAIDSVHAMQLDDSLKDYFIILNRSQILGSQAVDSGVNNVIEVTRILFDTENVAFSDIKALSGYEEVIARVFSLEPSENDFGFGGCVCTDDDDLADEIRCMRGSGGVKKRVYVKRTVNGRMSEAQAAFALMRLEKSMGLSLSE